MNPKDPYYPNQPDKAFVVLDSHPLGVGVVTRGFAGYGLVYDYSPQLPTLGRDQIVKIAQEVVEKYNRAIGVTKAQAQAAHIGSLFGWHVPGANPAHYSDLGPITVPTS